MDFREKYGLYERVAPGKVREIYENKLDGTVLLVATDRVSAFDKQLKVEIPDKGKILTAISAEMFSVAEHQWGLPTAFIWGNVIPANQGGLYIESDLDTALADPKGLVPPELEGRVIEQKKLEMQPVECIVRGRITGSAWKAYATGKRTICGVQLPDGLQDGDELPEPIFTPTTKAPVGQHDENITFEKMVELVDDRSVADEMRCLSLEAFARASKFAEARGLILVDSKFELGMDDLGNVKFGDELLTPDSSRYWDAEALESGKGPQSFDKQIIRDFLAERKALGEEPGTLPSKIVRLTRERYIQLYEKIVGHQWPNWI